MGKNQRRDAWRDRRANPRWPSVTSTDRLLCPAGHQNHPLMLTRNGTVKLLDVRARARRRRFLSCDDR